MKWYTRSCERPRKRSASEALPSSVSNRYSLSIRTHGSSCRRRASSSLRRVSSFSALSSSSRAASHSSRVPVMCFVIVLLSLSCRYIGGRQPAPTWGGDRPSCRTGRLVVLRPRDVARGLRCQERDHPEQHPLPCQGVSREQAAPP